MNRVSAAVFCLVLLFGNSGSGADDSSRPLEKWADPKLPVPAGLELWLDAAHANGPELVPHDGKLSVWFDASGNGHHLRQSNADAQPARLPVGEAAIVRFDGNDDFMRGAYPAKDCEQMTLFVVAAARRNLGGFRGVIAFNAPRQRDFESGITLDYGPDATTRFSTLNVEGRGFGGWRNLLQGNRRYGELFTFEASAVPGTIRLYLDGALSGERPRDGQPISTSEITVGARYYTLGPGEQQVQGFGAWDLAEVLMYRRTLSEAEMQQVRGYLKEKYSPIRQQLPPDSAGGVAMLQPIENPPLIQTLVPGFSVNELPVELSNINNVIYRPDGTLMAVAYNGVIWKLRDTDGDGLEDQATVFWDGKGSLRAPIGVDVTPPGYALGDGVFVVGKTQCLLIVDADHDGVADREIVVAGGWKESFHQVDGLGVAYDKRDGSVYFGRGTYNFADPLLKDKAGKPEYKLTDEGGAILRVSPDFKTREIVATGIRFPVGLHFNRHGDLFATDQEGATWVANGNPFDELLHIQNGRHYGFPPRHPDHLPGVIDEPSVYDYGPQHQSTCGFAFNDPVGPNGKSFGPQAWDGDAFVTGESRGKIYRTRLVQTKSGYVAQSQLFACLKMLTIDCCIAPDGSMRVACHSGGPDWGNGPNGQGKLFKIGYTNPKHPQPVLAWPSGPHEVRVEFDRSVDPVLLRDALRKTLLTMGQNVRAGDRFESIWPGYAMVQLQKLAPRYDLSVQSMQLTPDGRTLVLSTDAHSAAVHYALTLPAMGRPAEEKELAHVVPQVPEIDLDFDLSGCEATWTPSGQGTSWSGWLPHPDLKVARALTAGSATHARLWTAMNGAGELTLRTQMDLTQMLRPDVQPGTRLDFEYPSEVVTVTFESTAPLKLVAPASQNGQGLKQSFNVTPTSGQSVAVELCLSSPGGDVSLEVSFTTNEDARTRSIPVRRFYVPWSKPGSRDVVQEWDAAKIPELEGGSWARGRALFFGDVANCAKCHSVHGRGGNLGPDLSNLIHRDYSSVLRDITLPSFAINPDHVTYHVELKDGKVLTGVLRTEGERIKVGNIQGLITEIPKADVERISASAVSTMPEGMAKLLGPDRLRDLMTFLLARSPAMPDYGTAEPPLPRSRREVAAILEGAPNPPEPTRPISIVLVGGRKDHGPGEHDYPAWQKSWGDLFGIAEKLTVETADDWPSASQLASANVLVFYQQGTWTAQRAADLDAFLNRGGGAVYIHYAVDGGTDAPGFAQRIGLAWQGGRSKFRHGTLDLGFETGSSHPIGRNFHKVHFYDESYWQLTGDSKRITLLAGGQEDGIRQPLFWTLEPGNGRVVVSIPGHFSWTFDDPLFRVMLLRSIAWAAKEPVDRFNDLVLPGARVKA